MHARPRAKLNIGLFVEPRGRDGFHPLTSVFLRVGLADDLTVAFGDGAGEDTLTVSGLPGCEVEGNLVLRAFSAARAALGIEMPPLVAHLEKRIPVAAGLGGGSADAAAAIDCALQVWGASLSPQLLGEVALQLGSDVPFFARNLAAAVVTGRGEAMRPLTIGSDPGVLLVTPAIGLSTPRVYDRFDDLSLKPSGLAEAAETRSSLLDALDWSDAPSVAAKLRDANDLWPAAASLAPGLDALRDKLEEVSQRPWLLSGSGPTLFAIYSAVDEAADAGREIVRRVPESSNAQINAVDLVGPDPEWRYP